MKDYDTIEKLIYEKEYDNAHDLLNRFTLNDVRANYLRALCDIGKEIEGKMADFLSIINLYVETENWILKIKNNEKNQEQELKKIAKDTEKIIENYVKVSCIGTVEESIKTIGDQCGWIDNTAMAISQFLKVGDKIYESFSDRDFGKAIAIEIWKKGCSLFLDKYPEFEQNRVYLRECKLVYVNKIREIEPDYPIYYIPLEIMIPSEKLEYCASVLKKVPEKFFFNEYIAESELIVPKGIEVIEESAFENSKMIGATGKKLIIKKGIKRIEAKAFKGAEIEEVIFDDDCEIEYIGELAFYSMSLKLLVLPKSYIYNKKSNIIPNYASCKVKQNIGVLEYIKRLVNRIKDYFK